MKHYADVLREDQRLVILRVLAELPGYKTNSSMLVTLLGKFGHSPSRDMVKTELRWLEEQGLISVEDVSDVLVAKLMERGADVATGRATVPGVKRPGA